MKKKSILKKFISLGLCAATAIVFTACSDGSGGSSSSDSTGKAKYIVATEPTYAPFEYTDENNKIIGLDVEAAAVAAEEERSREAAWVASCAAARVMPSAET